MREMVLNHASLPGFTHHETLQNLKGVAEGMAHLVRQDVALAELRTTQPVHEIQCIDGRSLFDAFLSLRQEGMRDEFQFFVRLTTKTPILTGVDEDVESRFLACEETALAPEDGEPLLLCALTNGIAVGLPKPPWDCDSLTVDFDELLSNGEIVSVNEKVDNLTRAEHAASICERHIATTQKGLNSGTLWEQREAAFPCLSFGPDVEAQIANISSAHGPTIINRLAELHAAAAQWRTTGGPMPSWTCRVTPESASVCDNPSLRDARRFRSCSGSREYYFWHARYGSGGRIHLRFDAAEYSVEIGYIGGHLPL